MFTAVDKPEKVSDAIIERIRDSILSGQLKPGDRLASEKELTDQFKVSKATMREALRVLEVMGLIEIRKGTSGGAFVAEVDMRTTIHSIINFLHFQPVSIKEITMLRYLLEPASARIAASRRTQEDIERLRAIIGEGLSSDDTELSRGISFHRYLARIVDNTILVLIVDFIDNLLRSIKTELDLGPDFHRHVHDAHEKILECVIQGDAAAAGIAMANDVLDVGRYLASVTNTDPFEPSEFPDDRTINDLERALNRRATVVAEGDPLLETEGAVIRRVGSGRIFVVVGENREKGPHSPGTQQGES
jgi:GntR family transcriptional regulator, transcriptional repressor for pyruvate dehydrogenase complex